MAILPDRYDELISFLASHAPVWAEDPASIGLTEAQAAAVASAAESAHSALISALAARSRAAAATLALRSTLAEARSAAAEAIEAIRLYARMSGQGNAVYALAHLPPPDPPSPLPSPGTPVYTGCELESTGALTIRWRCRHPRGSRNVVYLIERSTPGAKRAFIGSTGAKSFRDDTLPAGSAWAQYTITAQRGSSQSRPCIHRVHLGAASAARGEFQRPGRAAA